MTDKRKFHKILDVTVFILLLSVISGMMFHLFYQQTITQGAPYPSDMKAYILEMQGIDSGYDFPYPIFFKLSALIHLFTGPEMAVALATLILNALSMVLIKIAFNKLTLARLSEAMGRFAWAAGILISLIAFSLFYVSMVYPPEGIYLPGIDEKYLGVFTPNPFHNATYLATRPFSILAFFWFAKLLPIYEKGYGKKWSKAENGVPMADYLIFAVSLLATTMTKPSFTLVFVACAGIIMAYRLVRSRFQNFVPSLQLGLCFIPTFAHLLYQYRGVFVPEPGEVGGIGVGLATAWRQRCGNIPLAIGLAMGFPILVLLLNFKELKRDTIYRLSWQVYAVSLAMLFFLYEKGFRILHMNFSWGYMHGLFFAFVGALIVLIKATAQKKRIPLLILQWLAYGWHLVCGIFFFAEIYGGGMYY